MIASTLFGIHDGYQHGATIGIAVVILLVILCAIGARRDRHLR